jgi:hypothetical protein
MSIYRANLSGAWIVSDFIGGYLVTRTYYGYTKAQALRMFKAENPGVK